MTTRRRVDDDSGFTMVEVLMVMFLMLIFGSILTAGLASAMKATRQGAVRVDRATTVETQLERLTRDLRVADPVRSVTSSSVVLDVYRSGGCRRIEWRVSGTLLQLRTIKWTAASACTVYPATNSSYTDTGYFTVLKNVTSATPFSYLDSTGAVLTTPTTAATKQISVTLTQSQPEGRAAVTLSATTYLRNAT